MAIIGLLVCVLTEGAERQLISAGWDSPNAAQFRAGLEEFEKRNLFDGTTIVPTRRLGDGSVVISFAAFSTNHWEWTEFGDCVRDLAAARPQRCTNNFLMLTANPGNVGWFDDGGWTEVIDHWRLLARVAKKGGLAGLAFDPEPYEKPWSQFMYSAQPDLDKHTFAEVSAKARERGRAVMKAVAEEFPDITLLAYRLFSDLLRSGDPNNPRVSLQTSAYGLLPAFVDGWCDVMPPSISIIDGNEGAYMFENEHDYAERFARLKTEGPAFLSPENRSKFTKQFLVGHGVYLDAYVASAGAKVKIDLEGMSPADRLMNYVTAALQAADGPVWIYGEKGRWWPTKTGEPPWPEKFQGIETALRAAKDPAAFARDFLREIKPEANLLRQSTNTWSPWHEEGSIAAASATNNQVRLARAKNSVMSQTVAAQAGQVYAIGAKAKSSGGGESGVVIGWRAASGNWIAANKRVEFHASDPPNAEGWRDIAGLVHVPEKATGLVFMFFARGQEGEAVFTDPVLVRVSK